MFSGMLKVDAAIYESNKIICRQISRLGESTRGEVSQEVLESLRHFVEHIILKEYANGGDIEDTHDNLKAAVKYVKNEPQLIHLSRFHHFLQVSSSHRVLKEHNAERLMLRYYEYLFRIKNFLYNKYSMEVLENLDQFPLDTNDELTEYYTKIATVVDRYNAPIHGGLLLSCHMLSYSYNIKGETNVMEKKSNHFSSITKYITKLHLSLQMTMQVKPTASLLLQTWKLPVTTRSSLL